MTAPAPDALAATGAAANAPDTPPPLPGRAEAFRWWLRLGCLSFGGPAGQIALMHEELVERRRWISEQRFLHALNYCMLLPGPEAQQLATYLGWLMHRTSGGLIAGALFVLPSLLLLIALSWIYLAWGSVPLVAGVFQGIKPAVTAIVVAAAWRLGSRALRGVWRITIALGAFAGIAWLNLPFPAIVAAAALAGWLGARIVPQQFSSSPGGGGHGPTRPAHDGVSPVRRAVIDDDTPPPEHARFSRARCLKLVAVFLGLWSVAIGALCARWGWDAVLTQMAWFFTKAALLTFGGAYAVLPYVMQGAVEQHHWLSAAQMIDGLALGETTPGPLIMVVAFVGFVGGWTQTVLGEAPLALSGAVAALVATFFTFLPSFLFILAGGPFIESTHGRVQFTAPLAGISAAVVGVIASLALFFGAHTLWPDGLSAGFDPIAALLGLAAGVALMRFRIGVIPVVLSCAALGALRSLLG